MASESVEQARAEVLSWPIDWPAAGSAYNQQTFEADVDAYAAAVRAEAVAGWREAVREALNLAWVQSAEDHSIWCAACDELLIYCTCPFPRLRALLEDSQQEGE